MILNVTPNTFRTFECLIAAKYGETQPKIQNASEELPLEKLPCLECADGQRLYGSHVVAKHLAKKGLSPRQVDEKTHEADVLQWFEIIDNNLLPNSLSWFLHTVSATKCDKKALDETKQETMRLLSVIDQYLQTRTFLIGERISLADVALSCTVLPLFQFVLDSAIRKRFVNLTRWFETCVNQPNFFAVLGKIEFCQTPSQFDEEKFNQFNEQSSSCNTKSCKKAEKAAKKDEKKDKSTAPAVKVKKETPVKEEANDEMDAAEEAMAQEPKQKDPFATMPKGTFILDEFKRVYSNEDTLTKAIPHFWEKFDPECYSIWFCEYKYPEELTLVFMSCNLIAGMFQRLDKLRKNAFSSMCLFGSDNNSTISGVWIWQGHELAFPLSDDWKVDYESYEWKKLDPSQESTKKLVNEYLAWEGDFGGKKFNQGKIFK